MRMMACLLLIAACTAEAAPPLDRLAEESDIVVLAQLERVDYEYRRGFPVAGRAWFRVLLPYKVPRPMDRLVVHEQGLKEVECYFPHLAAVEEQPRYLLFLIRDDEGLLIGHPEGCSLDVLVTTDNRYAIRWPQDLLDLDDQARELIRELEFQGPLAKVDASDMTRTARAEQAEREHMLIDGASLVYTRGILLEDFRRLLGDGLIPADRFQRANQG